MLAGPAQANPRRRVRAVDDDLMTGQKLQCPASSFLEHEPAEAQYAVAGGIFHAPEADAVLARGERGIVGSGKLGAGRTPEGRRMRTGKVGVLANGAK